MIKSGMAWHYSYFNSEKDYADAEKEARRKKTGIWVDSNPINPYEFRKSTITKR
jgi:endonuclease YncB( thermonuclease family)